MDLINKLKKYEEALATMAKEEEALLQQESAIRERMQKLQSRRTREMHNWMNQTVERIEDMLLVIPEEQRPQVTVLDERGERIVLLKLSDRLGMLVSGKVCTLCSGDRTYRIAMEHQGLRVAVRMVEAKSDWQNFPYPPIFGSQYVHFDVNPLLPAYEKMSKRELVEFTEKVYAVCDTQEISVLLQHSHVWNDPNRGIRVRDAREILKGTSVFTTLSDAEKKRLSYWI